MAKATHHIPPRAQAVTPYLVVGDGNAALAWYTDILGAATDTIMRGPGDAIMHAEIRFGESQIYLAQEFPGPQAEGPGGYVSPKKLGGTTCSIHLYVPDVDAVFAKAIEAGATEIQEPTDQFWGDRHGVLLDPFGHRWGIATHTEDLTPEEMTERERAAMAEFEAQGG